MTSWADLVTTEPPAGAPAAAVDDALNQRISVCHAPLESVEVDALVLPTDTALTHTSALAMRVSRAAGPAFAQECGRLGKLALGQAAPTQGHQLPVRLVVHTALPRFNPAFRAACATALADSITASLGALLGATPLPASVVLPCLHPEEQGWPQPWACGVVLRTLRAWLERRPELDLTVTLCADSPVELATLHAQLPLHFPRAVVPGGGAAAAYGAGGGGVPAATSLLASPLGEVSRLGDGGDDWRNGRFAFSREALGASSAAELAELTAELQAAQGVKKGPTCSSICGGCGRFATPQACPDFLFIPAPAGGTGGALYRARPQRPTHPTAARRAGGQAPEPRQTRPAAAASAHAVGAPRERER